MDRLTYDADFGLEDWEEILYSIKSDPCGAYNILDIAKYAGENEFDEILKSISLRLRDYEDVGLDPDQIRQWMVKQDNDGWIPVEERLPEAYAEVLVSMYHMGFVTTGHIDSDKEWRVDKYITELGVHVKAWRLLPEPYKP